MQKLSKFLVLAAGVMGIAAIFQPFNAVVSTDDEVISFSTRDLVTQMASAVDDDAQATNQLEHSLAEAKLFGPALWMTILVPVHGAALVLLLLGLWGCVRRRFGRIFGFISLLLGGAVLIFWALVASTLETKTSLPGLTLLLGTGAAAMVGGLVAMVKPDRVKATDVVANDSTA